MGVCQKPGNQNNKWKSQPLQVNPIYKNKVHTQKQKQKNPRVSDEDIIQNVSNEADAILEKIDEEE